VGDVILMEAGERVPADMILLRTSDEGGSVFIRTDQLDGETVPCPWPAPHACMTLHWLLMPCLGCLLHAQDWKLRRAVASTHSLEDDRALLRVRAEVWADRPNKEIDNFVGNFTIRSGDLAGQDREEAGDAKSASFPRPQ